MHGRDARVTVATLILTLLSCAAAPVDTFDTSQSLPHPSIPPPLHWPGALVIGIIGWIAMAAVIGAVVRTNAPPELLSKPSDCEPPRAENKDGE